MPTRELLAASQRAQFTELPATFDDRTLARFYTLSDDDLRLIRRHRRPSTQLRYAVQLGYVRYPGRVLHVGEDAHPQILAMLAGQLGIDPAVFSNYLHGRDTTRREHVLELQRDFGHRNAASAIGRSARRATRRANDDAGDVAPAATETHTGHIHGPG
jgi:TnpA family transposase